ncbi:NAD-dependent epimerase/dehydratase family protein [Cellulomonas sp.]|uniref:NAD-dependent epimerase/dehydratase family protein n=1 Tax=Cellulomonas sp. TaxID=40001 RepID=UPI003BAC01C6
MVVSERAVRLVARALRPDDRVLVTGAGGWFGSTVAALLHGNPARAMYVTQRPRTVDHGNGSIDAVAWDWAAVCDFAPTVVVDCAFVLRDYVDDMTIEHFVHVNTVLTQRLLHVAQLPGVRTVVSVSSGAAVHPLDASHHEVDVDPYGYLKRQAELALSGLDQRVDANLLVARPYSLSGTLVGRPRRYAFSDLISQAREGAIRVRAGHEVWRRYIGVDDFFAVCLAYGALSSGTVSSAGELVEFGTLAARVNDVLGTRAEITRAEQSRAAVDDYYTRDTTWDQACAELGYEPVSLDEQIRTVDAYLAVAACA